MKPEIEQVLEQQIRKAIFTANADKLKEMNDALMTIVMSHPKTRKLLFDSVVVNVDIVVSEIIEEPAEPKPKKEKPAKEDKPVKKAVTKMTDEELAKAIAKELNNVPDNASLEPQESHLEPEDDTEGMMN